MSHVESDAVESDAVESNHQSQSQPKNLRSYIHEAWIRNLSGSRSQNAGIVLYDPQQLEEKSSSTQSTSYSPIYKSYYENSVPVLGVSVQSTSFYQHHPDSSRHDGSLATINSFYGATNGTGAIRPGGAINILDRAYIGLLINFIIVGMIDAIPYAFGYPLFKVYLHLEGYKQQAATSMIVFGWTFKFIVGCVCDCIPIQGLRRKPYAMIGNVFLFLCLAAMTVAPSVDPYMKNGHVYNSHASNQSWRYVLPCMLASFGHAILGTATQAMMVDLSHRESEYDRGILACILHSGRFTGKVVCSFLIAIGCNSTEFGGNFSFSLGVQAITGILAAACVIGMYVTQYHMKEQASSTLHGRRGRQPFSMHMRAIYRIIERRVTWQFILFGFIQSFCLTYRVPATDTIYSEWLNGDTLTKNLFGSLQCGMYGLATYILGTSDRLRNTSWRTVIIVSTLVGTIIGLAGLGITIFDVYRNKYFALGLSQLFFFCDAFAPMVRTLVLIEIADPGYEATIYSVATSMMNIAIPLSTAASNVLSAMMIQTRDEDISTDTLTVRKGVMESFVIMYGFRCIVGIAILGMIPRQKREARRLIMVGSPNLFVPLVLSVFFVLIYLFVWTAMLLSLFESTACLQIAGGKGCK